MIRVDDDDREPSIEDLSREDEDDVEDEAETDNDEEKYY